MTENLKSDRIAFWLLPDTDDSRPLQAIIERLSARFGTPLFTPHITLHVVPTGSLPEPCSLLETFCANNQLLTLETCGPPQWSPVYNRALTLPVSMTDGLSRFVCSLGRLRQPPANYQPHLSLLYGNFKQETASQLIREINLNQKAIRFNRISAVQVGPKTDCADDVNSWQVVATGELRQKES